MKHRFFKVVKKDIFCSLIFFIVCMTFGMLHAEGLAGLLSGASSGAVKKNSQPSSLSGALANNFEIQMNNAHYQAAMAIINNTQLQQQLAQIIRGIELFFLSYSSGILQKDQALKNRSKKPVTLASLLGSAASGQVASSIDHAVSVVNFLASDSGSSSTKVLSIPKNLMESLQDGLASGAKQQTVVGTKSLAGLLSSSAGAVTS